LYDFIQQNVWRDNTAVFSYHLDKSRARGIRHFCIYAFNGGASLYRYGEQFNVFVDPKPWMVQKGGANALANSAIATYIHNRTA
jgi:hypothetical protein